MGWPSNRCEWRSCTTKMWWTSSPTVFEPATSQSNSSACGWASNHACHLAVLASLSASSSANVIPGAVIHAASSFLPFVLSFGLQRTMADVPSKVHSVKVDLGKCIIGQPQRSLQIGGGSGHAKHPPPARKVFAFHQRRARVKDLHTGVDMVQTCNPLARG